MKLTDFFEGSALDELPKLGSNSINAVITSPPYCNRYDYTRTYALELAFLGLDNDKVKDLRQKLLSATVENKSKLHYLQSKYEFLERSNDYFEILDSITECKALQETINALNARQLNGDLNNKSVIRMVEGYFTELSLSTKSYIESVNLVLLLVL